MPAFKRLRDLVKDALVDSTSNSWGRVAFGLLLLFIAIGPLLYGPAPQELRQAWGGGAARLSGTTLILLFAFLIAALTLSSGSPLASPRPLRVPLGAIAALAMLGVGQLVPLPEGILRAIAPVNLAIYHETNEILRIFGRSDTVPRISVAPAETAWRILLLLACTAFFFSTAALLRNRPRRRLFAGVLLGSALTQIVVAAVREAPGGRAHGAFRNADHFAGYLEIALAVAFGALWAEILTSRDRSGEATDSGERFERRFPPLAVRVLAWGSIAAGIALTQSRGGVLAAGITTCVLLGAAMISRRARSHRRAAAFASLAILFGVLFVAVAAGAGRFSRFLESDPRDLGSTARPALWRASFAAWREFPIVGSGLGTFREAIRRAQPRELPGVIEHAHNDLLQLLVTGGVIGAVSGAVLVASLLVLLFGAWRRQMHREESALVLAGFGALLCLLLHGAVEFNLSIPVIPSTLACVLGLSWAAATRT